MHTGVGTCVYWFWYPHTFRCTDTFPETGRLCRLDPAGVYSPARWSALATPDGGHPPSEHLIHGNYVPGLTIPNRLLAKSQTRPKIGVIAASGRTSFFSKGCLGKIMVVNLRSVHNIFKITFSVCHWCLCNRTWLICAGLIPPKDWHLMISFGLVIHQNFFDLEKWVKAEYGKSLNLSSWRHFNNSMHLGGSNGSGWAK